MNDHGRYGTIYGRRTEIRNLYVRRTVSITPQETRKMKFINWTTPKQRVRTSMPGLGAYGSPNGLITVHIVAHRHAVRCCLEYHMLANAIDGASRKSDTKAAAQLISFVFGISRQFALMGEVRKYEKLLTSTDWRNGTRRRRETATPNALSYLINTFEAWICTCISVFAAAPNMTRCAIDFTNYMHVLHTSFNSDFLFPAFASTRMRCGWE